MKDNKTERFELRMSPDEKNMIFNIARLRGISVSKLLISAALGDMNRNDIIEVRDQIKKSDL